MSQEVLAAAAKALRERNEIRAMLAEHRQSPVFSMWHGIPVRFSDKALAFASVVTADIATSDMGGLPSRWIARFIAAAAFDGHVTPTNMWETRRKTPKWLGDDVRSLVGGPAQEPLFRFFPEQNRFVWTSPPPPNVPCGMATCAISVDSAVAMARESLGFEPVLSIPLREDGRPIGEWMTSSERQTTPHRRSKAAIVFADRHCDHLAAEWSGTTPDHNVTIRDVVRWLLAAQYDRALHQGGFATRRTDELPVAMRPEATGDEAVPSEAVLRQQDEEGAVPGYLEADAYWYWQWDEWDGNGGLEPYRVTIDAALLDLVQAWRDDRVEIEPEKNLLYRIDYTEFSQD